MNLRQTNELSRFATRCTSARSDVLTVDKQEAQRIAVEYQRLLEYCTALQHELIQEKNRQLGSIEIIGPNW